MKMFSAHVFQVQLFVLAICLIFLSGCKQYSLAKEMPRLNKKIAALHPGAKIEMEYTSSSSDPEYSDSLTITISNPPSISYSDMAHKTSWMLKQSSSVVASLKNIRIQYRFPGRAVPAKAEKPFVYSMSTLKAPKVLKPLKK